MICVYPKIELAKRHILRINSWCKIRKYSSDQHFFCVYICLFYLILFKKIAFSVKIILAGFRNKELNAYSYGVKNILKVFLKMSNITLIWTFSKCYEVFNSTLDFFKAILQMCRVHKCVRCIVSKCSLKVSLYEPSYSCYYIVIALLQHRRDNCILCEFSWS